MLIDSQAGAHAHDVRAVLFATRVASADIPVSKNYPSALLPFGTKSFVEQIFEHLADIGIHELDLIVSDQPEFFRRIVDNGERWGTKVHWHLVKNPLAPYDTLRHMAANSSNRVLIGHADSWISGATLLRLLECNSAIYRELPCTSWAGWASIDPSVLKTISSAADFDALGALVRPLESSQWVVPDFGHFASALDARGLLEAQQNAVSIDATSRIPTGWIPTLWGAMSPSAYVHPRATMIGPSLIGPGCLVYEGATVGPGVVLAEDVVISPGSVVSQSLIMPDTILGKYVEFHDSIAQGNEIQSVTRGQRTAMPGHYGSLMLLHTTPHSKSSYFGRTMAKLCLVLLLPFSAVDALVRAINGFPLRWTSQHVVASEDDTSSSLTILTVRIAKPESSRSGRLLAQVGALLDVAKGTRCWFGIRPRSRSEWNDLLPDWKVMFSHAPIGLFHAPAWQDPIECVGLESCAIADVYFTAPLSWCQGLNLRCSILWLAVRYPSRLSFFDQMKSPASVDIQ